MHRSFTQMMKISPKGIEFDNIKEFSKFVYDNDLIGIVQLTQPIKDNSGMILVKENVSIKENTIKKLESLIGQYQPTFRVNITTELTEKLREVLAKEILPRTEKSQNAITYHLFTTRKNSALNLKGIILHSFYTRYLTLAFYRLLIERQEVFYHLVDLGLLALATISQRSYPLRLVNRYAFLAGLLADVSLSETEYWRKPYSDGNQIRQVAKVSSGIAQSLKISPEVSAGIERHPLIEIYSDTEPFNLDYSLLNAHPLLQGGNDFTDDSKMEDDDESSVDNSENFEDIVRLVSESLKIARFIDETSKKITETDNIAEKLIIMFSYNVEKGLFSKEIADPLIERFTDFQKTVQRIRKIAELETKCKYTPSAWAYPKPYATQIICKDRVYNCPNFISGWDISIVAPQEALGYIGTTLLPGSYPKCRLEKQLKDLKDSDSS